ncbi:O-acyltransferase [Tolypocladium capitatum]|uniref:O-acyltransferase n=1 Tax=Tolypocladium capitatum TaxID=45235 RepID=A0A2K3QKB7_9HYPO|nr:O-acyltransferase [Tolypocladium capitatum]
MDAKGVTPGGRPLSAPLDGRESGNGRPRDRHPPPRSLAEALHEAGVFPDGSRTGSETPSEEDYDENTQQPSLRKEPHGTVVRDGPGVHIVPENDKGIQDLLQRSSQRIKDPKAAKKPGRFGGLVFTQQFSAFDPHNVASANSPFHGFYVLFWLAVALFVFKISANNWRQYGTPLGSNEIMKTMFNRDVIVLLLSDGVMCGLTGVSWVLQRLVFHGHLNWDNGGWIVQNVWQTAFLAGVVAWTLIRDWPWTHTVFFVLHGIVMVMKQHSYAFYNGYLSTVYEKRLFLLYKLKQLDLVDPASSPSTTAPPACTLDTSHLGVPPSATRRRHSLSQLPSAEETDIDRVARAIASRQPLDDEQICLFGRIIKWEVDALADELRGTAADAADAYPCNLTFVKHYKWIPLPTVVYELGYPRTETISWGYVAEKLVAVVGILFVMIQVSQYSIYPVAMKTMQMKESGVPLSGRFKEFPWLLIDLIFPFMMEYLLVWYLIWEAILNTLAELTFFADRSFYGPWWNCVSWDQFARDWNRPVHIFLLRHVYHSSISSMKVNKHTATLITFFLSACVHELVMWCLFKKLRGYLLILQMCQLPLVRLGRTRWLRDRRTLGNFIFWLDVGLNGSTRQMKTVKSQEKQEVV